MLSQWQSMTDDKTVRRNTVQDVKEVNSQSLATQDKRGEHLVSVTPAIEKASELLADDMKSYPRKTNL